VNETALERTAAVCGVPEAHIYEAAKIFARSKADPLALLPGSQSVLQRTAKNAALINLHLAPGQVGKPRRGPSV